MMKKSLRFSLLTALCLVMIHTGIGHAEVKEPVSEVIRSFYENNSLAGLSVNIQKGNHSVSYNHGYGNFETRDRVTKDSVFRIASVSKLFTTVGILVLKEQGKLAVNDLLSKYIPDFPYGDRITIKNMLQHTSGIPDFGDLEPFSSNEAKEWKPDELVNSLKEHLNSHPLDFDPGTKAVYSNSNFMILGVIIETVSGIAFKDFMAQSVVEPLDMKNTGVGSDTEVVPHRVSGYNVQDGKTANAVFVSVVAPFATGDFMSKPKELAKISKVFKPGVLLSEETINEMSQLVVLKDGTEWIEHYEQLDFSFGYCWELVRPKGKKQWIYTKSGAISGFFAYVLFFKRAGVTVAISSNAQGNFSLLTLGLQIGEAIGAIE
jgi:CubicO group peptidase (beta-lactamase class C family)